MQLCGTALSRFKITPCTVWPIHSALEHSQGRGQFCSYARKIMRKWNSEPNELTGVNITMAANLPDLLGVSPPGKTGKRLIRLSRSWLSHNGSFRTFLQRDFQILPLLVCSWYNFRKTNTHWDKSCWTRKSLSSDQYNIIHNDIYLHFFRFCRNLYLLSSSSS